MDVNSSLKELEEIEKGIADTRDRLEKIARAQRAEDKHQREIVNSLDVKVGDKIDGDLLLKFFKKPYVVIPQGRNKILVAVPKFIKNFAAG